LQKAEMKQGSMANWRRPGAPPSRPDALYLLFWFIGSLLVAFLVVPLIALAVWQSWPNLSEVARMTDVREAIALSLEGAFLSATLAAVVGVPLAYGLARTIFPGKSVIAALIDLPLAVPHTVAGIALLMVFGRRGVLGEPLQTLVGLRFWGTIAGIVVAMLFVSAPYTVNAARIGFEAVDPRLEKIARTIGLGPWQTFLRITLPLARRSITTGIALTYARSISEFGAVVILVYYPMTAPVKVYELFLRFGLDQASAAAVLLLAVSLALFLILRALTRATPARENR
jgi:molybdate/tungstate transport system permease protein